MQRGFGGKRRAVSSFSVLVSIAVAAACGKSSKHSPGGASGAGGGAGTGIFGGTGGIIEAIPVGTSGTSAAGIAGSAGTGGSSTTNECQNTPIGMLALIDDFEDGDSRLIVADKRAASWVVFNDGTGQQQPRAGSSFPADRIPGGRGSSRFGLHTHGRKFSKWGAALSVELSPRRCYDASAYAGISFWARGRASVRISVKMTQVVGEEFGGSCLQDCYDGHGALRTFTKDWTRYELRWEDLAQSGFGTPLDFDPHSLYSIEFAVAASQPSFDFWIDDVSFLSR